MDLALYGRVLWRFRWLVLLGVILAVALAILSVAKITSNGLTYRNQQVWASSTTLLLTQPGFPWGRVNTQSDPNRFQSLTDLYAQLANGDGVRAIMRSEGAPRTWSLFAYSLRPTNTNTLLPVVALSGQGPSPADAIKAVTLGRKAFGEYIVQQQASAAIPAGGRIEMQVIQNASPPTLITKHKKTLPVVILLAVLSASVALAFVLENLRPRPSAVAVAAPSPAISSPATDTRSTG